MRSFLFCAVLLFLSFTLAGAASVDVRLLKQVPLEAPAKQLVATADGQRIYVLTQDSRVQLFSADGRLEGDFPVAENVTGITPQGQNRLVLLSAVGQELLLVGLMPVVDISSEGAPTLGPADAPVAVAVFDDFECPYCARAVPLLKDIQQAYPEQVKLVFKNFPLSMHKNARAAAIAGLAAQRQGKFWPLHDLLFANYNRLSPQKIRELASQAGLDMARFDRDFADPALQQQVNADMQEGQRVGVRGTPTIFINGRRLPQRNKAALEQMIEEELQRSEPQKQEQ